ncbi:MAG: hypothetical protein IJY47_00225 [Clostridia bacterium]|nr:hypothetical protein [Clostridia bacterium]
MAISNFIPTIWSENLYRALDKQYIAVANCNREYEGDIQHMGSVVKICGVGEITIGDYTKDTDLSTPQALSDTVRELTINQAKYFNFQIDDVDRAQCTPKLMDAALKTAADSLSDDADKYVYGLWSKLTSVISNDATTVDNILDSIISAREKLYRANVTDSSEVVLEVSPAIASLLFRAKMNLASDNTPILENGCVGSIAGCKIFVSNNIVVEEAGPVVYHKCFMRTKRAIAFAEQLSEIDAYRPEKRFADAVKGLHLYGAELIYPAEAILMDLGIEA